MFTTRQTTSFVRGGFSQTQSGPTKRTDVNICEKVHGVLAIKEFLCCPLKFTHKVTAFAYFFKLPRATPAPAEATVRGTSRSPAIKPAGSPINGTSAPLATK